MRQMTKLEIKLTVIELAINSILATVKSVEMNSENDKRILEKFLKNLE